MTEIILNNKIEAPHPRLTIAYVRALSPCRSGFTSFVRTVVLFGKDDALRLNAAGTRILAQRTSPQDLNWLLDMVGVSHGMRDLRDVCLYEFGRARNSTSQASLTCQPDDFRALFYAVCIRTVLRELQR